MKIHVWKRYTENRASEPIEEGIYEQGDPKLFGLWQYLIDNGNAVEYVEPQVLVEGVYESINKSLYVGTETPETIEVSKPEHEEIAQQVTVENDKFRAKVTASMKTEEEVSEKPKRGRKKKDDS